MFRLIKAMNTEVAVDLNFDLWIVLCLESCFRVSVLIWSYFFVFVHKANFDSFSCSMLRNNTYCHTGPGLILNDSLDIHIYYQARVSCTSSFYSKTLNRTHPVWIHIEKSTPGRSRYCVNRGSESMQAWL